MEVREHQPTPQPYLDLEHFPSARMVVPVSLFESRVVVPTENAKQPKASKAQLRWLPEDLGEHPPEGPLVQLQLHRGVTSSDPPRCQDSRS